MKVLKKKKIRAQFEEFFRAKSKFLKKQVRPEFGIFIILPACKYFWSASPQLAATNLTVVGVPFPFVSQKNRDPFM